MLYQVKPDDKHEVKPTFAWSREVAAKVAEDYSARGFGPVEVERQLRKVDGDFPREHDGRVEPVDFCFDLGGSLISLMPSMRLPEIVCPETTEGFACSALAHQVPELAGQLQKLLADPGHDRGGWIKIHQHWNCLCLPIGLVAKIAATLNALIPEADEAETAAWTEWRNHRRGRGNYGR